MADEINKFYTRLRNASIDNQRKTQREAFELLAKHIQLMDKQPKRALKTMTDVQETRIKQLVSEFGITINTIFQNLNKATFGGIGGLQTRFENLATMMRDILFGPYDTDDKMFAVKLTAPLIEKLKQLIALMGKNPNAFKLAEKKVVQVILANMEPKPGNIQAVPRVDAQGKLIPDSQIITPVGYLPAYQPLGTFTDILVENPPAPPAPRRGAVSKESAAYKKVIAALEELRRSDNPEVSEATKAIQSRLKKTKGKTITADMFDRTEEEISGLQAKEEGAAGPPPGKGPAMAAADEGDNVEEYD
jgi:hypothetical protein